MKPAEHRADIWAAGWTGRQTVQQAAGVVALSAVACAAFVATAAAEITITWDESCPAFFQPDEGQIAGILHGIVEVGPGEHITHYTFYNAFTGSGESLEAWFTPEFLAFIETGGGGSFVGPVVSFTISATTTPGLYDQNPYDAQNPFPYLQLHDQVIDVSSNAAGFEVIVVDQFPPVVDLNGDGSVDGADLGLLLGNWGCVGAACTGDINGDGFVDGADLGLMLGDWTP